VRAITGGVGMNTGWMDGCLGVSLGKHMRVFAGARLHLRPRLPHCHGQQTPGELGPAAQSASHFLELREGTLGVAQNS
jgi:hypothetical protein